jgi:hypothetical protein
MKEDEIGWLCSTDGRDENGCRILVENLEGRDYLEDARIVLRTE